MMQDHKNISRRECFLLALGFVDLRLEVQELFASLAAALSGGDSHSFLQGFDESMPGFGEFRARAAALIEQNDLLTSIEFLKIEDAAGGEVRLELDWLLELRARNAQGSVTRRREVVRATVARRRRKWKVIRITPQEFFAPSV